MGFKWAFKRFHIDLTISSILHNFSFVGQQINADGIPLYNVSSSVVTMFVK